jgi:hypothetical protein
MEYGKMEKGYAGLMKTEKDFLERPQIDLENKSDPNLLKVLNSYIVYLFYNGKYLQL